MCTASADEHGSIPIGEIAAIVHHYILLPEGIIAAVAACQLLFFYSVWLRFNVFIEDAHDTSFKAR